MKLGFRKVGQGPEGVIVFNDWFNDTSSYKPMFKYLDVDTFTYAVTDVRGYGRSRHIPGRHTAYEAAADAFAVADYLGWERFHIVGYSMTGMVVERMAIDATDRIKSVVAICPISAAGLRLDDEMRKMAVDTLVDDDRCRELASRITGHRLSEQWAEYKLRLARDTRDPDAARGYLRMFGECDFSDEAMGVETPFLVVVGEYDLDGFLEEDMKRTFLRFHPNAELHVIRNVGHCPMQESPVYLQTIMEKFMKRQA